MRNGKGTGGRVAQMENLERIQVVGRKRLKSKGLTDLDAATEDLEVNPMAPGSSIDSQWTATSRPRPRLRPDQAAALLQSSSQPINRPSFTVAAPGQQFGFRMPNPDHRDSRLGSPYPSNPSLPASSRASSIFSGGGHSTSTVPTSRAPSACSSSGQGSQENFRRRSSHLQKLALASQSVTEVPNTRMSHAGVSSFGKDNDVRDISDGV